MRVFERYDKPRITFEQWLSRTTLTCVGFFNNHGIDDEPEKLLSLYEQFYEKVVVEGLRPELYPDASETLQRLLEMGKRLGVLSSHPKKSLVQELKNYGLDTSMFLFIMGESRDKVSDLEYVAQHIRYKDKILYVGDGVHDVQAAKEACVHSCAITRGYHAEEMLRAEKPEFLIHSLSELPPLLE